MHQHLVGRQVEARPQLAADAPVVDVLQPAVPRLLVLLRLDRQLAVAHRLHRAARHVRAVHVPLRLQQRLHDVAGARADGDLHLVVLLADEETQLYDSRALAALTLQVLLQLHAHVEAHHARVRRAVLVDATIVGDHATRYGNSPRSLDELQIVSLAALEIVGVVGGRELHRTRAEVHVDQDVIADDGDAATVDRVDHVLAVQVGVARVLRVHRHSSVAQHRLETRGGGDDLLVGVLHWVRELRQAAELVLLAAVTRHLAQRSALHVDVLHLYGSRPLVLPTDVADRRAQLAAPVHQALAAVDLALLVQADERLLHRRRQVVVHRERLAAPVHGGAQATELVRDGVGVVALPLPHLVHEGVATQVVARLALVLHQLLLHHDLRGDTGVVHTRHPQRLAAAHALPADDGVLDGICERVAQMQRAGDVWRRNHHDELLIGGKVAARLALALQKPEASHHSSQQTRRRWACRSRP